MKLNWKRGNMTTDKNFVRQQLYAYPDVGRTGLCNMLFPWARAVLFAHRRHCPLLAPQWTCFNRLGPWLRGERDKRYYLGQFTNNGYIKGFRKIVISLRCIKKVICENEDAVNDVETGIVVFRGIDGYFDKLCGKEDLLRRELYKIVNPQIIGALKQLPKKFIGVHVRRGDFVATGQELPLDYYRRGVDLARKKMSEDVPVLLFSDGVEKDLDCLRDCHNIVFMPPACALHDLLALSKASVIVGTNHSSFSEWAAFLGGMPSIWDESGRPPSRNFENIFV